MACGFEPAASGDIETGKADQTGGAQSWTVELQPGESKILEVQPAQPYGVLTLQSGAATLTVRPNDSDAVYRPVPGSPLQSVAFGVDSERFERGEALLSVEIMNTTASAMTTELVLSDFDAGQCGSAESGPAVVGQILLVCDEVTKQRPQTVFTVGEFRRACLFNDQAVRFHLDGDLHETIDGRLQTESVAQGWDFELYHDGNWTPVANPEPKTKSGDDNWIEFFDEAIYFHTEGMETSPPKEFFLEKHRSTLRFDHASQTLNVFTQRDLFLGTVWTNWDMDLSCRPAF
jgi:hypothetical protein